MKFPQAICSPCGHRHGRSLPWIVSIWKEECDICGNMGDVTAVSDYGYIKPESIKALGIQTEEISL